MRNPWVMAVLGGLGALCAFAACSGAAPAAATAVPAAPVAPAAAPAPAPAPALASMPAPAAPVAQLAQGSVPAAAAEGRPVAGTPPRGASAPADATEALAREIQGLIGRAGCANDGQCLALPMGSKPCGGPERYVAWSSAATDRSQLEALAARYKEARAARNQRLGLVSDCAVVPEPAVRCVAAADEPRGGRCELVPGRGRSGALTR